MVYENVKSQYFLHWVVDKKISSRYVTSINSVTSYFSALCVCFNKKNRGEPRSNTTPEMFLLMGTIKINMFVIIKFLCAFICFHIKYLCKKTESLKNIRGIPYFMSLIPDMFCAAILNFPWNYTSKMPCLPVILPHIHIF